MEFEILFYFLMLEEALCKSDALFALCRSLLPLHFVACRAVEGQLYFFYFIEDSNCTPMTCCQPSIIMFLASDPLNYTNEHQSNTIANACYCLPNFVCTITKCYWVQKVPLTYVQLWKVRSNATLKVKQGHRKEGSFNEKCHCDFNVFYLIRNLLHELFKVYACNLNAHLSTSCY